MPLLRASSGRPSVSPEPSAARMLLLILWRSPTGYCCRERQNSSFVLEYASTRVSFLYSIYCKRKEPSCDIEDFIETHICKLRGILRSCMKNKVAVWFLGQRLVTGVCADIYITCTRVYEIICLYVRIVTVDFSLKYVFYFFSRYLVVSSRYDFIFQFQYHGSVQRNTWRSDFV